MRESDPRPRAEVWNRTALYPARESSPRVYHKTYPFNKTIGLSRVFYALDSFSPNTYNGNKWPFGLNNNQGGK